MLIKLTESGLVQLQRGGDLAIINVSNDRAYHLMVNGHANKDKSFMAMYERNNPKEVEAVEKTKAEPKPAAKKEKATSRKAAARETAVKK